jgi:hypothetical protein
MERSPRAKPAITTTTVTIPAGQSVSTSANLTAGNMVMMLTPPDWTPANVGFLVSQDNVTFKDLFDFDGNEIVKSMGASRAISVDPSYTTGSMYVKLRSGPLTNPVPQSADRVFTIVIQ